jgi:hypothetical protein
MAEEKTRCLAIVQLAKDSTLQRLHNDVPKIVEFLSRFSKGEHEQAFRSNDGTLFGFFLKTDSPHFLEAEFDKCAGTRNGDTFFVFEVGKPIGANGFGRAWTWLQRH